MIERGRNSGITGFIDIPGRGASFAGFFLGFKERLEVPLKNRSGRGHGQYGAFRPQQPAGGLTFSGKIRLDQAPIPSAWENETGTVYLRAHADADPDTLGTETPWTQSLGVRIAAVTFSHDEKSKDLWDVVLVCQLIDTPGIEWSNTTNGAAIPAVTRQELWANTGKNYDPTALTTSAQIVIDVWGNLDNSNDAELTQITTAIAEYVAPIAGQVVRRASFNRDSRYGGVIVIECGVRTTEDDIEMPQTITSVDPSALASSKQVATVRTGTTATSYSNTAAIGSKFLKLRATNTVQLHNGGGNPTASAHVDTAQYAHRSTEDDIEMPGTPSSADVSGIASGAQITTVRTGTTATVFAATLAVGGVTLKLHSTNTTQIHDGANVTTADQKWQDVAVYRHRTPEDDIEMPGTFTVDDQSRLADQRQITTLRTGTTVTAYAATITAGGETLKLVDVTPRQIHDGGGSAAAEKWEDVAQYRLATREDELEMGASGAGFDHSGLDDKQNIAVFTGAAGTASATFAASVTVGTNTVKLIGVDRKQLHDSGYLHVGRYGVRTLKDQIEQESTRKHDDPSDLATQMQSGSVRLGLTPTTFPSTTSVGGFTLKLRGQTEKQIHDGAGVASNSAWIDVAEYGLQNREDEIEQGGTISRINFDDARRDTVTTLAASALSASAIAEANFLAGLNDPTNESLEVKKLHDGMAVLSLTTRATNKVVIFDMQDANNLLTNAYLDAGTHRVFLADYFQADGTNSGFFLLLPGNRPGAVMRFGLQSYTAGATLPMHWDLTGTRNDAAFLGLAAKTVTYKGIVGRARLSGTTAGSGEGIHMITQEFIYDSRGILDQSRIPVGVWLPTTNNLSGLSRGSWISATSVGLVVPATTESNYGVFL